MKRVLFLAIVLLSLRNLSAQTWTVSTTQSYSSTTFTYDNIIVQNGAILSLTNCTINIKQLGKISIQQGGKLVLNSCNVSVVPNAAVPNYWVGIEVLGNAFLIQTPANQGQLVLQNTTIEKALIGISVGKPKYDIDDIPQANWHLNGGGIVTGINSTIKNCRYAMVFSPYYNPSFLEHPTGNKSTFKGCTFMWDGNSQRDLCAKLMGGGMGEVNLNTLVELNQVHDIIFSGCIFKSTRTFSNWFLSNHIDPDFRFGFEINGNCRGRGLVSFGASFQIQRDNPCNYSTPVNFGTGCTVCYGNRCVFEGLSIGIYIDGYKNNNITYPSYPTTNLEPYHEISGAQFLNNRIGIVGYEKTNVVTSLVPINDVATNPLKKIFINRCVFETNDNYYNYHYMFEADYICLKNCGNVEMSENSFTLNKTTNALKPTAPNTNFSMCWSGESSYIDLTDCNYGPVSIHKNSFYLSKFKQEDCRRFHNFNSFHGLNSDINITCNTYASAPGMDFRHNEPNSCYCDLNDWLITQNLNSNFSFKTQLAGGLDAGNIWNSISSSPQTDLMVYNINTSLDVSHQNISYNFNNSNPSKEPLVLLDPNNKFIKTGVTNSNNCTTSPYCKFITPRKYYDAGTGSGPIASPILPDVMFDFSVPLTGGPGITVVLTPLEYLPTSGVVTITNSEGIVIFSYIVNTNGHAVGFNFDFSIYPSGTYYITFTDVTGKKYTVVIVRP